ncbi:MAG: class I and II aminotransferase [Elusimicrobia bacterium CG22_combo_CG10-13_8_21_14_all_63_91]|nr:MAG: class I and II aminotransferase [Elusimicrobia bacterium CG22_combo_CG10-13_8_21_14_all_63_91]
MIALILAAGCGNRMRPFTDTTHKTLIDVCGKPIINHIFDNLIANDIRRYVVVTGYRAEELEGHIRRDYGQNDLTFIKNEQFAETNNIYSLALAIGSIEINEDILLIESDLVIDSSVIAQLLRSPFKNVALVDKYRNGMDGTVVTLNANVVTSVIPGHLQNAEFDFSDKFKTLNIYKFSKEFCSSSFRKLLTYYAKAIDDRCYYELILGMLVYMQQEVIHAEIVGNKTWAEIDDPNDLAVASFQFGKDRRLEILDTSWGGFWNFDAVDFGFIRNMYFPSSGFFSQLRNSFPMLLQNYCSKQSILNRKLSYFLLCDERNIHVLNGASQVFPMIRELFGHKCALLPAPTFGEYGRLFEKTVMYGDSGDIDWDEVEGKVNDVDVVVFVNPNNPTGTTLASERILKFARGNPTKRVVVDESFIEFSGEPSLLSLLEKTPSDNVLVIKSLSKSLGIPGMRLGYIYSTDRGLMGRFGDRIPIWNLNSVTEHFLEMVLKYRRDLSDSIASTIADREEFRDMLKGVPDVERVFRSGANFVLVCLGKRSPRKDALADRLLASRQIYIRDISDKFSDGKSYFRFAVRLPTENADLIAAIKGELVEEVSVTPASA